MHGLVQMLETEVDCDYGALALSSSTLHESQYLIYVAC